MLADIDIGLAAIDRGGTQANGKTYVAYDNPANNTGAITDVEIWAPNNLANCEVATFTDEGSNVLSTRDTETIGSVTAGSKQTFSGLNMDVVTGDYIGIYFSAGNLEADTTGAGMWYITGDYIPCSSQTFTWSSKAYEALSLYGEGSLAGWTGKVSGVTNPAKVMGIDVANINKVKGVT